jgi:RNA polymerase sigma-70 factor (ECF subfamily)
MNDAATDADPSRAVTEPGEVRRAREGDLDAFEGLYRRHVDRIHGLCLRLAGDPGRAEELTQEVFLRAWRKLDSFRGESAFGTWLHRLAVNLAIGAHRRRNRHDERFLDGGDHWEPQTPASRVDPASRIDLERAVAGLPAGARQAFLLYELEGYTHEEISELTGLAPGTSRAQVFRARKLLRKVFLP